MKEYYINEFAKITAAFAADTVTVTYYELMGGRWNRLGEPETMSLEAAAEEYGVTP